MQTNTASGTEQLHKTFMMRKARPVNLKQELPLVLGDLYPNPFFSVATIPFTLHTAGQVRLALYTLRGRLALTLLEEALEPGEHAVVVRAEHEGLRSGNYYYRLEIEHEQGTYSEQKLMNIH